MGKYLDASGIIELTKKYDERYKNTGKTYYAGKNISIDSSENISALGYTYDINKDSITLFDGPSFTLTGEHLEDSAGYHIYVNTSTSPNMDMYADSCNVYVKKLATGTTEFLFSYYDTVYFDMNGESGLAKNIQFNDLSSTKKELLNNLVEGDILIVYNEDNDKNILNPGNTATGLESLSTGYRTTASGQYSIASGWQSTASGTGAIATGARTEAKGNESIASNQQTITIGDYSHAEGYMSIAGGFTSHAEGRGALISDASISLIETSPQTFTSQWCTQRNSSSDTDTTLPNVSLGQYSHTEGVYNLASAEGSHTEGFKTYTGGGYSHAEGYKTSTGGPYAHAEGKTTTATEEAAHAEGSGTTADDLAAHAEGVNTYASLEGSHAEGIDTESNGKYSHAEGTETHANGQYSHAEGYDTTAIGETSHAEGESTIATGNYSHAEGYRTKTHGMYSHAEGNQTDASGANSHAEGYNTLTKGANSHAEGDSTIAYGNYSHAEGSSSETTITEGIVRKLTAEEIEAAHSDGDEPRDFTWTIDNDDLDDEVMYEIYSDANCTSLVTTMTQSIYAGNVGNGVDVFNVVNDNALTDGRTYYFKRCGQASGIYSHVEGYYSISQDSYSHAEGKQTTACGTASHTEGYNTVAAFEYAHAEGYQTVATDSAAHAEGQYTKASNVYAHAEGQYSIAGGAASHSEGINCKTTDEASHAEGKNTYASSTASHAEGYNTHAEADYAHAEGESTMADGTGAHSEGNGTYASADYSHAEGFHTSTDAQGSHAEGLYTSANSEYQHVEGKYNILDEDGNYQHIVGGGTSNTSRSNIYTLDWSGNGTYAGRVNSVDGFYQTSDEKLKDFQNDVEVDFDELKSIPKVYFTWKDNDDKVQMGTSAQKVEAVYPELVATSEEGVKSVDYAKLSIVALKAIDILDERVNTLATKNEYLTKRLIEVENKLAELENKTNEE